MRKRSPMRIIDLTKTALEEPANQGVFFSTKTKFGADGGELKDSSISQAMQSIKNYKKIV